MAVSEAFEDLAEHIEESLDDAVLRHEFKGGELIIYAESQKICQVLQFLSY